MPSGRLTSDWLPRRAYPTADPRFRATYSFFTGVDQENQGEKKTSLVEEEEKENQNKNLS